MMNVKMIAIGRFLLGFLASPPACAMASKPIKLANNTELAEMILFQLKVDLR